MLLPKPNQIEFEQSAPGTYPARCYRFLDLGTQPKTYQGQTKLLRQIRLSWELPTELMTKGEHAGKPFTVHNTYTWSMSEKAILRKTLEAWRGKKFVDADFGEGGFDTRRLIGVPCMIGISHTEKEGKTYSNISSVSPLLKGYQMPAAVNETLYFSFDDLRGLPAIEASRLMEDLFGKLSPKTKEMLTRCPEYLTAVGGDAQVDESHESFGHASQPVPDHAFDESIPF
jgi:hypothetical protein